MDLKTAARIKANSRLKPAKDISVVYAELMANTNPDLFADLQARLVLTIDAAAAEYQILTNEIQELESLIPLWEDEIAKSRQDVRFYQEEVSALDEERDSIFERVSQLHQLDQMKAELVKANLDELMVETAKLRHENVQTEEEIHSIEVSNERRRLGLDEVVAGFEDFLLIDRPSGNPENVPE
jgi:chromosome segregation ATPase